MITKKFRIDFYSDGGALTLDPSEVSGDGCIQYGIVQEKNHPDGWIIRGEIHDDYYQWVNKFEAIHPIYGRVWGDFEEEVFADSEDGYAHFYENHKPYAWDYADI